MASGVEFRAGQAAQSFSGTKFGTNVINEKKPEFLSFTRRGALDGNRAFAAIPDDFDWSVPQEPKAEGQKLDLTEGE